HQEQESLKVHLETQEEHRAYLFSSLRPPGVGIPRHKHRTIFEAFTQVDGSTTRQYGGTGLGLSISSRIVELMGGGIGLESAPGQGSTFSFELNFKRQAPVQSLELRPVPQKLRELPG